MLRRPPAVLLLLFVVSPLFASLPCTLTAVPLQVSAEGLAEPIGDILLRCTGGVPGANITGSLQVSVSRLVANTVNEDGALQGATLSLEGPTGFTPLPAGVRLLNNNVLFENILFPLDSQGIFHLRISGIRAAAVIAGQTQAALQFSGNEQLLVQTPTITVARSQPSLTAALAPATAAGSGPAVPESLDFNSMLASGAPVAASRLTEGYAAAFTIRQPGTTNGMRFLIRLSPLPTGARIFAADAVAGSNADTPTISGTLGGTPSPGLYNPLTGSSLLLGRVRGAAPDGSGGSLAFTPGLGPQPLSTVGEAESGQDGAYLVYEVLDANPSVMETAQVPFWLFLPTDQSSSFAIVRQTLNLAPVSEQAGSVPGAPIPRYAPLRVPTDCVLLGDCRADYFPYMAISAPNSTSWTAPSGGPAQTGSVLVHNNGGGLLEWQASVRYIDSTGWLTISPESGVNNGTVRYDVNPAHLAPGEYHALIEFQRVGTPLNMAQQISVGIQLVVTDALPPPPPLQPLPTIADIVSPGSRWGMPFAPGSLAVLLGTDLSESTTVTVGGLPARLVLATAGELTIEIPPEAPIAAATRVVATNGTRAGQPYLIDLVPVSPDTLFVLNSDDEVNTEDRPVEAGATLQLFSTGTRAAAQPLSIKIHERFLDAQSEILEQPGVELVKITVPADFPTMPSEVRVCAKPATDTATAEPVCGNPKAIWIKAAPK
jgi:uncharacterized protein (TIGR03437 family)